MNENLSAAFISAVKKYRRVLIYIPGSPDPDAISSSHAIKIMLARMDIESEIMSEKKLSLSQNRAFVRALKIPLKAGTRPDASRFDAYIITDFQTNTVPGISGRIPCAAHIDHHEAERGLTPADFSLIRPGSGSTSALVALLLKDSGISFSSSEMKSAGAGADRPAEGRADG